VSLSSAANKRARWRWFGLYRRRRLASDGRVSTYSPPSPVENAMRLLSSVKSRPDSFFVFVVCTFFFEYRCCPCRRRTCHYRVFFGFEVFFSGSVLFYPDVLDIHNSKGSRRGFLPRGLDDETTDLSGSRRGVPPHVFMFPPDFQEKFGLFAGAIISQHHLQLPSFSPLISGASSRFMCFPFLNLSSVTVVNGGDVKGAAEFPPVFFCGFDTCAVCTLLFLSLGSAPSF